MHTSSCAVTCVGVFAGICKQFTTYALMGMQQRAQYVVRGMLVSANNPSMHTS